jgi:hypothetical protein
MTSDRSHDILGTNDVPSRGVLWGYGTRDELVDAGNLPDEPRSSTHFGKLLMIPTTLFFVNGRPGRSVLERYGGRN